MKSQHFSLATTKHNCFRRETLVDFQLGKLAPGRLAIVAAEISQCPRCDAALAALDNVDDTIVAALQAIERPASTDSVSNRSAASFLINSGGSGIATGMSANWTGKRLGQYLLEEQIGRGGMASVWRATHQSLKRARAIKLLPVDRLIDREAIQRFFREMEITGRLEHPHLVLAHDAGEECGQPYLVMELLDGCNLGELVQRLGRLPVADACELVRQAAIGLAHAHSHQSLHRDVKPSNLFLTRNGIVKVLDLGMARMIDVSGAEVTHDCQIMGTPMFMSPEQFQTPRQVGVASDVYSLGCTLYFLLIGEAPFAAGIDGGIFSLGIAHATKMPSKIEELRAFLPAKLFTLVSQMLSKSPCDRPSDMNIVVEQLVPFCTNAEGSLQRLFDEPSPFLVAIDTAGSIETETTTSFLRLVAAIFSGVAIVIVVSWGAVAVLDAPSDPGETGDSKAVAITPEESAVGEALTLLDLSVELRDSAVEVVRQHPGSGPWSGRAGHELFAIHALHVPQGKAGVVVLPALISSATTQATADLVQTQALLQRYSDVGLTDAATLRAAFVRVAGNIQFSATIKRLSSQARRVGAYVIAISWADEDAITVGVTSEVTTGLIKAAYRDVMHQQSRELMARKEWNDALSLWRHLHQRQLISADLYLDASRCFHALGKDDDALCLLSETLDLFAEQARWELLEQAGVLASKIKGEQAEKISQRSFELALQRFQGAQP